MTGEPAGTPQAAAEAQRLTAELLAGLEAARTALLDADADALLRAALAQQRLVNSLEQLSAALGSISATERSRLEATLAQCRSRNLANATLLEAQRNQVQWGLRWLGLGGETVYGRDGTLATPVLGRSVGCA